jgi:hypothetical protein
LKEFMDEQAKINKDTVTKFKTIDKVLENIYSKVTEVRSFNHQVLNMMKMLETQVGQLAGRLTNDEGNVGHTPRVLMQGRKKSRRRTPTRIPLYSY